MFWEPDNKFFNLKLQKNKGEVMSEKKIEQVSNALFNAINDKLVSELQSTLDVMSAEMKRCINASILEYKKMLEELKSEGKNES